ncbi:LexA/Signal peptidase [Auriculariales sp. MPI-PUGE-AT-0066]|nr:LexA/Signal peptidase [Auriculariales sp. MPI-PUGE-AT-0066]
MSSGASMYPTMPIQHAWYLEDRFSIRFLGASTLRRGDIVVALKPTERRAYVAKRIVGLPGDTVCVDPAQPERGHVLVPKGHVWLAGDNRDNSTDSRDYGPVPIALIHSRIIAQVWKGFKIFRNPVSPVNEVDSRGRPR